MGCYDTIDVYMECPYCGDRRLFDAQTKDIGSLMFNYKPYRGKIDLLDRSKIPVFGCTPFDKSTIIWKNQDERAQAMARVPDEYKHLKFVHVIASCHSPECQFDADREDISWQGMPSGFGRSFEGKIAIKDGLITGIIYDIEKKEISPKKLNAWKTLYPKEYRFLMKKYKHEPFAVRHWNRHFPGGHKLTIDTKKKKIKSEAFRFPTILQPGEIIKTPTTRGKK